MTTNYYVAHLLYSAERAEASGYWYFAAALREMASKEMAKANGGAK